MNSEQQDTDICGVAPGHVRLAGDIINIILFVAAVAALLGVLYVRFG